VRPDPRPAPASSKQRIVYVVVPHPDDEFEAWALLEDRPHDYPVFVLCTHGERTGMAGGAGHQPALGEWTPPPQPWGEPGSDRVRAQRLNSFTRVVLHGGDGALTPAFVTAAVQRTRDLRTTHLPLQREWAVVGAAYWSDTPGAAPYAHPDHRAVHEALWSTDQGVPGPQWCRTATADPDVAGTGGRTAWVSPQTYRAVMGIAPDGQRTGLLQVYYGWLGPPSGWPYGETDASSLFSRQQSFWRRHG
jgi:LmbE family N-acetylglucosaminyl deacetylase